MPLVPWRPFRDIDRFFDDWDNERSLFSELPEMRVPRTDVYETDKDVIAKVELPGLKSEDIDVEVKNNVLTVQGKMEDKKEEKRKGYFRKEISKGFYKRSLPLPVGVEDKKAKADYKDGLLSVTIPKAKPKKEEKEGTKVKVEPK